MSRLNHTTARERPVKQSKEGERKRRNGHGEADAEYRADAEKYRAARAACRQSPQHSDQDCAYQHTVPRDTLEIINVLAGDTA